MKKKDFISLLLLIGFACFIFCSCKKETKNETVSERRLQKSSIRSSKFTSTQDLLKKTYNYSKIKTLSQKKAETISNRMPEEDGSHDPELEALAMQELVPIHQEFQNYLISAYPTITSIDSTDINDPDFTIC